MDMCFYSDAQKVEPLNFQIIGTTMHPVVDALPRINMFRHINGICILISCFNSL